MIWLTFEVVNMSVAANSPFIFHSKNKIGQKNVNQNWKVGIYFDSNILIQKYKYEYFLPA